MCNKIKQKLNKNKSSEIFMILPLEISKTEWNRKMKRGFTTEACKMMMIKT